MAMNPMQRKTRNAFLLGFIAALIVGGVVIALLFMQIRNKNAEINRMREAANVAMADVYILSKDIRANEAIEVQSKRIPLEYVPDKAIKSLDGYMDEEDELIMKSKVDLTKGTILTEDMVENDADTTSYRMVEYTMIALPSKLATGDYADIRLSFQDGENFVVLSKVEIQDCTASTIWLKVSESEMLKLDAAILESYIIGGTRLYATQYIDSAQHDLNETYVPSQNVLAMIERNASKQEWEKINSENDGGNRSFIESALRNYTGDEKLDSVNEGIQSQKSLIQANRAELLGEMGY